MSAETGTPSILVVDDDRELRTLITDFLSNHGLHARGAADAAEMDAALTEQDVDPVSYTHLTLPTIYSV